MGRCGKRYKRSGKSDLVSLSLMRFAGVESRPILLSCYHLSLIGPSAYQRSGFSAGSGDQKIIERIMAL